MKIIDNIHIIPNVQANSYLIIESDSLTIIDTGTPLSEKQTLKYIASLGRFANEIEQIKQYIKGNRLPALVNIDVDKSRKVVWLGNFFLDDQGSGKPGSPTYTFKIADPKLLVGSGGKTA